jgi:hypothetical protein
LKKFLKPNFYYITMKKEASVYVFAVLLIVAIFMVAYYVSVGPTGQVISHGEYTNETSCVGAGFVWEEITEQNCTNETITVNETYDCEPCLEYEDLNGTQGDCISWTSCVNETTTEEEVCVDVVVGGECVEYEAITVSVLQPSGDEYTSLSEVPLVFTIAEGTGTNLTCLYSVSYAGGELAANTSVACEIGENTNSFSLSEKGGDNVLTLYVSDSSGSALASSPVFSFDISDGDGGDDTGDGGSSSESETSPEPETTVPEILAITQISLGAVPTQEMVQGASVDLGLSIQNTGTLPVSSCGLVGDGSWVTVNTGGVNLGPGEGSSYGFSVKVPEDATEGAHTLAMTVNCAETSSSTSVTVNVLQKKLDFNITDVRRTRDDRVSVDYILTELAGEDQEVEIFFFITDAAGVEVGNASQNRSMDANESDDFRTNIQINDSLLPVNETSGEFLETDLKLSANFNSQIYSSSVLEPITLGAPIGGFAIFGGTGAGSVVVFLIVLAIVVAIFFVARKLRRKRAS